MNVKSFINAFGNKIHEVNPLGRQRKVENAVFERMTQLRFGMWVRTPRGVGIIVDTNWAADATIYVDLTNGAGETVENRAPFQLSDLRQASWQDIPSNRRPDRDLASRMGYI